MCLHSGGSPKVFPQMHSRSPVFAEDKLRGNDYNADSCSTASAVDKLRRIEYRLV